MWSSVQICDACWFWKNPGEMPVKITPMWRERTLCNDCKVPTRSGIYVRRNVDEG